MLVHSKAIHHGFCGGNLGGVIQMGINIGGCGKIAVSQPLLNLFHRHAVCQQKAGTGMAQIMKANRTKAEITEMDNRMIVNHRIRFHTLQG